MPFELEIRHENLSYIGSFAYPTFNLWGKGALIAKGLYDALVPYGVTLQNVLVTGSVPNAAETIITVQVPKFGALKFSFQQIDFNFTNFTSEFFESIPAMMDAATRWIPKAVPDFRFTSHQFAYLVHAFVKDSTPEEVLKQINPREVKSAGVGLGNGAIFNYLVPEKNWQTQLFVDKSAHLPGSLFVNLVVTVRSGDVDYAKMMEDGRSYLKDVLSELDLNLPEVAK